MRRKRPIRILAAIVSLALASIVLGAVATLPSPHDDVAAAVAAAADDSGVAHPVTAVLLQFRVWDTFLEVAVLLLAVIGAVQVGGGLGEGQGARAHAVAVPLLWLVRLVVPALVLAAGHLLLLGAYAPGGAFQAGALLAAAAVLLALIGRPPLRRPDAPPLRTAWIIGPAAFLGTGAFTLLRGRLLFELPPPSAGLWILALEAGVAIGVGAGLGSLFLAARSAGDRG